MRISIRGNLEECQDATDLLALLANTLRDKTLDEADVEVVVETEIPAA